jgi:hypothetical protein
MLRMVLLMIGLLITAAPSLASAQSQVPGSYKETCSKCRMQNDALVCACRKRDGRAQPTFLWLNKCPRPYEVINMNGDLQCVRADSLPPGSYKKTCGKCSVKGNSLTCDCQRRDGGVNRGTRINYRSCNWISNDNGNLVCGR